MDAPDEAKILRGHVTLQELQQSFSGVQVCLFWMYLLRVCYLWPQLSANIIGVQGKQCLARSDVQNSLMVRQCQHAVVEDALNAEPGHAVQNIWMETQVLTLAKITFYLPHSLTDDRMEENISHLNCSKCDHFPA